MRSLEEAIDFAESEFPEHTWMLRRLREGEHWRKEGRYLASLTYRDKVGTGVFAAGDSALEALSNAIKKCQGKG